MQSPVERVLYRWAWLVLVAGGMVLIARMTRFEHLAFRSEAVGPGSSQIQLTEAIWDRWYQEVCFLVRGIEAGSGSEDYRRVVCWSRDVPIPPPRRVSSTPPTPPPHEDLIREYLAR